MTRQRRSTRCWHRNDLRFREGVTPPRGRNQANRGAAMQTGKRKIASRLCSSGCRHCRFCWPVLADGAFCTLSAGSEYLDQRTNFNVIRTDPMHGSASRNYLSLLSDQNYRIAFREHPIPAYTLVTVPGQNGRRGLVLACLVNFRPAGTDGVQGDLLPAGHHLLDFVVSMVFQISVYVKARRLSPFILMQLHLSLKTRSPKLQHTLDYQPGVVVVWYLEGDRAESW